MMIKFNMQGFEPVPEGERVLIVDSVELKPSGKPTAAVVKFKDQETNRMLQNRYSFEHDGAMYGLGLLVQNTIGLPEDGGEMDTSMLSEMQGYAIIGNVVHTESEKKDGSGTTTFANLKGVISGFNESTGEVTNTTSSKTVTARSEITEEEDDL